jgi:hypothetical protein
LGLYKIFHPEIFQGNLKKKNYFEGWFFKHVSGDLEHVISIIPGIALNASDPHAFIQTIDGITGKTDYVPYPLETFQWDKRQLSLQLGSSSFSMEGISLDIHHETLDLTGELRYHNPVAYPVTLRAPGIMGWFSYVPFMECYHGIVSASHTLEGSLTLSGKEISYTGGKGYIEKDWGTSFPEFWLWVQCNNFPSKDASLFFSVAKIPWLGSYFMGFIAFFHMAGKYHVFSTYNKSRLSPVSVEGDNIFIELENKSSRLSVRVIKSISGVLKAPKTGHMSRRIKESNDAVVEVTLQDKTGRVVFQETGQRAGLEEIEQIYEFI